METRQVSAAPALVVVASGELGTADRLHEAAAGLLVFSATQWEGAVVGPSVTCLADLLERTCSLGPFLQRPACG